jgi:GT2 family glycosyltransferase
MNLKPKIDVTILSWDRIEETIAAIDSALSQEMVDQKVIVVDQGSQLECLKKLREYCEKDSRIQLVCNRQNKGVPGGRNQAADQGVGEYIVALDNDAEFVDSMQLYKAYEIMNAEADLGVLAFRVLRFGSNEDDHTSWSYHSSVEEAAHTTFYSDRFVGAGHMIRRDAFSKINGYDDDLFFLHEEVDLSKRMINAHYKIKYSPEVVIGHKVSAEHRVAWSAGRWTFDVRNKTYLHLKFKTPLPTFLFHTGIMVLKGIRSGLFTSTFLGLYNAFILLPLVIKNRKSVPYLNSDAQAKAYFESCSPTQGMTAMQRIKMRLKTSKPVPVSKPIK